MTIIWGPGTRLTVTVPVSTWADIFDRLLQAMVPLVYSPVYGSRVQVSYSQH